MNQRRMQAMMQWLDLIESDYLRTYIGSGGSSVKFVCTDDSITRSSLMHSLEQLADRNDFFRVSLNASLTRLHLFHNLFHEMAKQVDWDLLTDTYLRNSFERVGLTVPKAEFPVELATLAQANGLNPSGMANRLNSLLRTDLTEDYAMSHEFRTAALHLCLARIKREDCLVSSFGPSVKRWLRGEIQHLSELKDAMLFQKISRSNARYFFLSLAHMLRKIGRRGMFVILDISRYLESNVFSLRTEGHYYTPAAVVDLYELLRQLIDEQDAMEGVFIIVLTSPRIFSDHFRGLHRYQALEMRIVDDVRVRSRQNLLAPLVRF